MRNFTLITRLSFLFFLYFGVATLPGFAQSGPLQYGTSYVAPASHVANPGLAADGNPSTAATLQPVLLNLVAQPAAERVQFAGIIPAGSSSGLYIQVEKLLNPILGNTLDASLFNSSTVNAYLNGTMVQSWSLGSLLSAQLLQQGKPATLTVAPNGAFNQLEMVLDGTLNGYSTKLFEAFAPSASTITPLPVELVGFQGRATAAGVQLSWQTASELNSSYFAIERSLPNGDFTELGRVAGAGSSAQAHSYQFRDAAPAPLGYYRLRQVDADGTTSFSPVVVVRTAPAAPAATLAAYPSPATETVQLSGLAPNSLVAIYDQQGRWLRQATVGEPLDVRSLPAGLYLVRDAATGSSTRFVKAQ